jgi:hypothetical protein
LKFGLFVKEACIAFEGCDATIRSVDIGAFISIGVDVRVIGSRRLERLLGTGVLCGFDVLREWFCHGFGWLLGCGFGL